MTPVRPSGRLGKGALSLYRDRLGFDTTFQGPGDNDSFFGIVQRGAATIMLKDVGVEPVPNYTRDIGKGIARWNVYLHVPDPDALAAEFSSRNVEFFRTLEDEGNWLLLLINKNWRSDEAGRH